MERDSTASIKVALALLLAMFAAVAYRAATAPMTTDEALAFNRAIGVPAAEMFQHYDPSNDVLYTYLAKGVLAVFRLAEWSVRLPALAGAALYLWAVFRLARRLFGADLLFLAAVTLLTLHPLVVDCLGRARGSGLALALWMWALVFLLESDRPQKLNLAGVALGLSVAAHLSFIFPALALVMVWGWGGRSVGQRVRDLVIPTVVTAVIVMALPLSHADVVGFPSGSGALLRGWSLAAIPLMIAAAWSGRRIGAWTAGLAAITFVLLVMSRRLLGTTYPSGASGAYWVPLLTLAALAVIQKLNLQPLRIGLLLVAGWYAFQFPVLSQSAAPRDLAKAMRKDAGRRPVRIGVSASVAPVLEFYRTRYGQWNWSIAEGKSTGGSFDYFVYGPEDGALAEGSGMRILYKGGGLVLAR